LLKDESAVCRGIAFHFPDDQEQIVLAKLRQREGKNFDLVLLSVHLTDTRQVYAYTSLYTGRNLITDLPLDSLVAMIRDAQGRDGHCRKYVTGIANALAAHDIRDPCVEVLMREIHR